jgi:predicted nuclease of predicted toxin-antitoxin system
MIKLLLDQGLPRTATNILKNMNIDTLHVGDIGAATAEDEEILHIARKDQRTIVTMDADFHTIIALSGAISPSVVRIRRQRLPAPAVAKLIREVLDECKEDLDKGAAVTVDSRIRVKRYPLIR